MKKHRNYYDYGMAWGCYHNSKCYDKVLAAQHSMERSTTSFGVRLPCSATRSDIESMESLSEPIEGHENNITIHPNVVDNIYAADRKDIIYEVLSDLSEREARIILLRFGFFDGTQRTLDECAALFNLHRERVRQIEAKALRKLRHPARYGEFVRCGIVPWQDRNKPRKRCATLGKTETNT